MATGRTRQDGTDSWDRNEQLCELGRVRIKFTPGLAGADFKQTLKLR